MQRGACAVCMQEKKASFSMTSLYDGKSHNCCCTHFWHAETRFVTPVIGPQRNTKKCFQGHSDGNIDTTIPLEIGKHILHFLLCAVIASLLVDLAISFLIFGL